MRAAAAVMIIGVGLSGTAYASDFVDTRVSVAFADDNVLENAGESSPNSPSPGFGAGAQNKQFYDNFNTKFSGFETLSNIVLYKRMPAFFEGLTTEAALTGNREKFVQALFPRLVPHLPS